MSTTVKRIAVLVALFVMIVFAIFVFNQTVQIVQSARAVNMVFGSGVMWGLIFTYCLLLVTPVVLWFRLPKRMLPPASTDEAEHERYMSDFRKRLSRNPRLRGIALNSSTEIAAALQILDKQADDAVVSAASAVFLSTAVLQSGRLDALVVLTAQTRIIWQVAHIYYQRPSLRDFTQLYANVASTAFIAAGIEDVDVDVLVSTVFGSTVAAIPGMHLLTSSILSGSANAFLTLRVGMITKEILSMHGEGRKKWIASSRNAQSRETTRFSRSGRNCQVVESCCKCFDSEIERNPQSDDTTFCQSGGRTGLACDSDPSSLWISRNRSSCRTENSLRLTEAETPEVGGYLSVLMGSVFKVPVRTLEIIGKFLHFQPMASGRKIISTSRAGKMGVESMPFEGPKRKIRHAVSRLDAVAVSTG